MKKKAAKKEPKLSPFAKLCAELELQKAQTRDWRDKYKNTMEGRMESVEEEIRDMTSRIEGAIADLETSLNYR